MEEAHEVWKPVPGFPGYRVSDQGRVRSCFRQMGKGKGWVVSNNITRILSPGHDRDGYTQVRLARNGKYSPLRIAALVMLAFRGPPPTGLEICHNNNVCDDNRLANLRYDTHSANLKESVLVGKASRKLTPGQAEEIRTTYARGGISQRALAHEHKVHQSTIWRILHKITYVNTATEFKQGLEIIEGWSPKEDK